MRFRIRTVRRRRYRKRKKIGKGLPYIKNNHVYFGQGVIGKVLGNCGNCGLHTTSLINKCIEEENIVKKEEEDY